MRDPEPHPAGKSRRLYRFGDFTLDLDGGFLRRGGDEVTLPPKPLKVLTYLVEHHGRLVSKEELIDAVWPDAAITDNSLAQCLREVRRALADDSQQMIRTVARRGYLFTVPVTTPVVEFPHPPAEPASVPRMDSVTWKPATRSTLLIGTLVLLAITAGLLLIGRNPSAPRELTYTQITNFTDSAVAPVLSPDGRMVAFLRSEEWFHSPDPIYVKMLPHGEAVEIIRDPRLKYGLAFSPDGTRIAYTVLERGGWKTLTLSPIGGQPRLLLPNASGLTWLDQSLVMFSEVSTGVHMGVVTAKEDRSEHRKLYFPKHERSMAHLAYASPDRKWALVLEMNPIWQPCRVIPMNGSSPGRQVGPSGKCTSTAWSPDGKWMYFGVEVGGEHHLWRQRFPNGEPEQITFGPTEEDGIAVAPDGRSLITSIGIRRSVVWIRDDRGERAITSEGYVAPMRVFPYPSVRFSTDGKSLFYLMRRDSPSAPSELWRTDLQSEESGPVLPGVAMTDYDISNDGSEVIFSIQPAGAASQLWLAPLDRSAPPRRIASTDGAWPHFGPDGQVLFLWTDGKANYLTRIMKDGSQLARVFPEPIGNIYSASPDRRWIVVGRHVPDGSARPLIAIPTGGGAARQICENPCHAAWAPDGRFFYVEIEPSSRGNPGKTLAIPVPPGEALPRLPASGIRSVEDAAALPGVRLLDGWNITRGPDLSVFAYVKTTMHRNLFRIPLSSR